MGYTDQCDIFASFNQEGFNQIIHHIQSQRPSLFNYATADVAENRELWCVPVEPHPIVPIRNNPLMTIVDPLPIPGTPYGINFAVQLTDVRIDFHPGDVVTLPPELTPLKEQRLAIYVSLCGGLGCPPRAVVDKFIPPPVDTNSQDERQNSDRERQQEHKPIIPLPTRKLHCFCLEAHVTGGVRVATYDNKPYLEPFLDGFEIVDIRPEELENNLECYVSLMLQLALLPGLRFLLQHAPLNLTQGATDLFPQPTNVILRPMLVSANLPNNPAIEDDQLKVFIRAEVN